MGLRNLGIFLIVAGFFAHAARVHAAIPGLARQGALESVEACFDEHEIEFRAVENPEGSQGSGQGAKGPGSTPDPNSPNTGVTQEILTKLSLEDEAAKFREHFRALFDLAPALYGNITTDKRLVNQSISLCQVSPAAAPEQIVIGDDSHGFRTIRHYGFSGGVGYLDKLNYADLLGEAALPVVGILPIVGASVESERFAPTRHEAEHGKTLRIPLHAADIGAWDTGDRLTYQASGGVAFTLGLGTAFVGVRAGYVGQGEWVVTIEKRGDRLVHARLTRGYLQSLNLMAGTIFVTADVDAFRAADREFSFVFDLRDGRAARAFEDFVRGHVIPAQKIARETSDTVVRFEDSSHTRRTGHQVMVHMSLPFIAGYQGTASTIHAHTESFSEADGTRDRVDYGIYMKESQGHFLNRARDKTRGFFSAAYESKLPSGQNVHGSFGTFLWSYETNHGTGRKIHRALRAIEMETALGDELRAEIPDKARKLGYVGLRVSVTLGEEATKRLVSLMQSHPETGAWLEAEADDQAARGLAQGDKYGACEKYLPDEDCRTGVSYEARRAGREMGAALAKMAKASKAAGVDSAAFATAYGEFGRAMMSNPFAFQAGLALVHGAPVEFVFQLEGERLSRYRKKFDLP